MRVANQPTYQAAEFARRTGVTIRALHHYDRLGLLKPSGRTGTGYRLYGKDDFVRLQQIVTFKFIGFPLKEIRRLLDQKGSNLAISLRAQRRTLEAKREQLNRALKAIQCAEELVRTQKGPGQESFRKIIEVIQMQTNPQWSTKYYNEEAQKLISERASLWNPELQKQTEEAWAALFKDTEKAAADQIDPASETAQALVARQTKLIEAFTGGHAAIQEGLNKLWQDQENWPDTMKKQVFEPFAERGIATAKGSTPSMLTPVAQAFLDKAIAASRK